MYGQHYRPTFFHVTLLAKGSGECLAAEMHVHPINEWVFCLQFELLCTGFLSLQVQKALVHHSVTVPTAYVWTLMQGRGVIRHRRMLYFPSAEQIVSSLFFYIINEMPLMFSIFQLYLLGWRLSFSSNCSYQLLCSYLWFYLYFFMLGDINTVKHYKLKSI